MGTISATSECRGVATIASEWVVDVLLYPMTTWLSSHGGRLPVRPDANPLVSTRLELATWVLAEPEKFF